MISDKELVIGIDTQSGSLLPCGYSSLYYTNNKFTIDSGITYSGDNCHIVLNMPDGAQISVKELAQKLEDLEERLAALECSRDFNWDK
jgi:hypothetical protein